MSTKCAEHNIQVSAKTSLFVVGNVVILSEVRNPFKETLGDHIPNLDHAMKLAKYFDCSLDFLFGFTDKKERRKLFSENPMSERLERAIEESGKSKYALAKEYEFDESQFYRWCHGLSFPSLANLVKLCEALGCSLDDLAGFSSYGEHDS